MQIQIHRVQRKIKRPTRYGPAVLLGVVVTCLLAPAEQIIAAPPDGKGKGGGDIPLTATFRDGFNDDGFDDKVRSDGGGAYVSERGSAVEITKDGDLRVFLEMVGKKTSGMRRLIRLQFDDPLTVPNPCTSGDPDLCPPDPDLEPLNGIWIRTMFFGGAEPRLNFRAMQPDESRAVRLFMPFSTTQRATFWLRFDPTDLPQFDEELFSPGFVQVTATDENTDGEVDRWTLEPWPGSDSRAKLIKREDGVTTEFGDFRMPFELQLDRVE